MTILGLDIGSSSVKAAVLRGPRVIGSIARREFETRYDGVRAEVDPAAILRAVTAAIRALGTRAARVDAIALATMSPAWVAMDRTGKALTPIVTHQDRRSVEIARQIESRIGESRHLHLAGNRPFPGGISSTTCAWFLRHERSRMRRADLVGHLSTFLHRRFTGARVIDPSNASFTGLYRTLDLRGWSDELCDAVRIERSLLPEVRAANAVGGTLTKSAATTLGLRPGTPMLVGCVDTSAVMLLAGAEPGLLVNVTGSTDVLAMCTDKPRPHERLLTRALGVGRRWMSVSTLAAAGSALEWAREQLFTDLSSNSFYKLAGEFARTRDAAGGVTFDPHLAGDRTSIQQRRGAFEGLSLATTRRHLLAAIVDALARSSAQRLQLLKSVNPGPIKRDVLLSGGASDSTSAIFQRDWPGTWRFTKKSEATLRGLALLEPLP